MLKYTIKKAHPVFITFRNTDNVHQKYSVNIANSLVALTGDILSPEHTLILHLYKCPVKLKSITLEIRTTGNFNEH